MRDDDGCVVFSLKTSNEAKESGDFLSVIFIEPVKPDKGIEQNNFGTKSFDCGIEFFLIFMVVKKERRTRDEMNIKVVYFKAP